MSRERWDIYVRDMLDRCARIERHASGLDRELLTGTAVVCDAVLWNITVLGEAANNIPDTVQRAHTEIPWAIVTATRNRVVHGYGSIDPEKVWEIVSYNIPELKPLLRALLEEAEAEAEGAGGADPT